MHECQSSARLAKFGKGQDSGEKEDGTRSKCVRVKGRVAKKSLLARNTPPGKAVRENRMPPMKHFLQGSGGRNGENRERKQFFGWLCKKGKG